MIILIIAITVFMAWVSRKAGSDLKYFKQWPEIVFGLCFGAFAYVAYGSLWLAALCAVWSCAWMETGHGNAMHDGVAKNDFLPRRQKLDFIILPVCAWLSKRDRLSKFDFTNRSTWYCRIFMFTKGALIGLPLGLYAPILGAAWALSYSLCFQPQKLVPPAYRDSTTAEILSGGAAGLLIVLILLAR